MPEINRHRLHQRNVLLFVLVAVLVISVIFATISLLVIHPPRETADEYERVKNILFMIVDDLRPALRCYGDMIAVTPNIDMLASRSIIFKNAYSQQALDGPSRISLMTSRRPDHLRVYDEEIYWQDNAGDFVTLPQHFKNHGYETISVGQVFKHGNVFNETDDYVKSWTFRPYLPPSQEYETKPVCDSGSDCGINLIWPVNIEDEPGGTLPDIEVTEYAINYLRNRSKSENKTLPFFLGIGYLKPHIPFRVPENYYDLYENMSLVPNNKIQPKFPTVSWNPWTDIRKMDDVKKLNVSFPYGPMPDNFQKLIRQGYYASISYIDDLIGKLLEVLEETGYAQDTTIVLLSDNGFSLGEHQEWSKYSNFEVSVQVPLILHVPEFMDKPKRKDFKRTSISDYIMVKNTSTLVKSDPEYISTDLVELVDIFPTLAEITNLPVPLLCNPIITSNFCSEGISFYPVIDHLVSDPWVSFSWKTAVFSQYPRPSLTAQNNSDAPALKDIIIMGYSVRTDDFRYIEWVQFDNSNFKPDWPMIISRELYNHKTDSFETINLCDEDHYSNTVISLSRRIKRGWRDELPPGLFDSL